MGKNLFYVQWHITNRCNCRCIHCYQDAYSDKGELDISQLLKICGNLESAMDKWNRKLVISLTGGEPFLKEELFALMDYLDKSEFVSEFNIITNGTIINDKIISINKAYKNFNTVYVSIDGIKAETNDAIRGKGVFEKVIKNVKILKENKYKIIIMFTLLNINFNEAADFMDLLNRTEVDGFMLERFIPMGQSKTIIEKEFVNMEKIKKLYARIYQNFNIEFNETDVMRYRALRYSNSELQGSCCTAGVDGTCVMPDATIYPCRRLSIPYGNILEQPLDKIWGDSTILKDIKNKEKLQGKCRICKLQDCYGCRAMSLSMTGDYLSEDVQCLI